MNGKKMRLSSKKEAIVMVYINKYEYVIGVHFSQKIPQNSKDSEK